MAQRVYIDGHAGTTGLRIREWLGVRDDLELVTPAEAVRKDPEARRRQLLDCDLAILCLPDDAAREAVGWAEGSDTRILDTSTAHRVADDWVYGLPELATAQRDAIRAARRVSNPGCYASGFVLATRPLIDAGLLAPGAALSLHALSGYSGGGRSMIEKWESPASDLAHLPYAAPYSLEAVHKHVPEMMRYSGITTQPQFLPAVGPFRCGMRIQIPLHAGLLGDQATGKRIWEALDRRYRDEPFVHLHPLADPLDAHERHFDPTACNDSNRMELHVVPHVAGHVLLVVILDNLGKGAAGVAIQSLNLMLGFAEDAALRP
jgi:N-acetyl-gamma-glutamyl-phosphate reductase